MTPEFNEAVYGSDILICTPGMFLTLLLNPNNLEWANSLGYVIFDEVHLITVSADEV